MSALHTTRSLSSQLVSRTEDAADVYRSLLQSHEIASMKGAPLLTDAGVSHVQAILEKQPILPFWDSDARQLWLRGALLKTFRQPAPQQTILLNAYQEQGWDTVHLDDPLPRLHDETDDDARHRLQATIKNLNRSLPPGSIRLRGDGTGLGVRWAFDDKSA